jgi:hypothetical protein
VLQRRLLLQLEVWWSWLHRLCANASAVVCRVHDSLLRTAHILYICWSGLNFVLQRRLLLQLEV